MAILKPIPGSPSRLSLGMRQSSKMRLAVDEARMPSLSSFFPSVSPGVGMGTRKALMPCKAQRQGVMFSEAGQAHPVLPRSRHKPAPSRHLPHTSARGALCWLLRGRCRLPPQATSRPQRERGSLKQCDSRNSSTGPQENLDRQAKKCLQPRGLTDPLPGVPTLFCKDLSVLAKTTAAEASQELVIQALVPFRTHESPSARAVVEAAPASLPFPAAHTDSESKASAPVSRGTQPRPSSSTKTF